MTTIALPLQVLPAPRSNREGDLIYVSTIYPIDPGGNVVHADAISPHVGEAEIAAQTRAVLEAMRHVLAEAGSSLDRVLKAEVYLVDPAEFYEFKLVWKEYFPHQPPARTTAIVGDSHIIPGARLSVSAVALASDASVAREYIHTDRAPDPLDAEWCAQAIKAAPFVFPSPVPATDFETGIAVKRNPVAPYYGSDMELQARYLFEQWGKILAAAGSGLDQALKSQAYELDLKNFHDMDGIWDKYIGHGGGGAPPTRSSMAMRGLLVPEALFVANVFFLAPDTTHQKRESREGIGWHPEDVRNVHFTPGLWAGGLVLHGWPLRRTGLRELQRRDRATRPAPLLLRHRDSDADDHGSPGRTARGERPLTAECRGRPRLPRRGGSERGLPGVRACLEARVRTERTLAQHELDPLAASERPRGHHDARPDRRDRSDRASITSSGPPARWDASAAWGGVHWPQEPLPGRSPESGRAAQPAPDVASSEIRTDLVSAPCRHA